jgi:pimeloyl-ACP methyl ester carboxylesterase
MCQPQFERLADDYHCLAPDLPECENSAASDPFTLKDASRRVADVIRERIPGRSAHLVGLSISGAIALQMLCDEPQVLDHLLVSGTATRLPSFLDNLNRPNEKSVHLLNRERLVFIAPLNRSTASVATDPTSQRTKRSSNTRTHHLSIRRPVQPDWA